MIFANLEQDGKTTAYVFDTMTGLLSATFGPDVTIRDMIPLTIGGRTYKERQNRLRELAIEVQLADDGGLSWSEAQALCAFFEEQGRRYGLLREFRENAICLP